MTDKRRLCRYGGNDEEEEHRNAIYNDATILEMRQRGCSIWMKLDSEPGTTTIIAWHSTA